MAGKNPSKNLSQEILLGIDYGESRIGLAFGRNTYVMPAKIISGKDAETAVHEICRYLYENKIDRIIIGLPLSVEGKETTQSRKVRKFANLLKLKSKKPVSYVNEYRTSEDSKTEAINLGVSKKRRREIDDISAAIILKEYYAKLN